MKLLLVLILAFVGQAFAQEFYNITEKSIKGEDFKMSSLKEKVALIVNIASQCGYTSQLEGLESLYKKYQTKNFVVVGVPTNDFGGQTPEDDKAMLEFCQKNYNATFPILTKKTVKGEEKRELYKFLTEKSPKEFQGNIGWNFEKFLINKNGKVVGRFGSSTSPDDKKLNKQIQALIAE